MKRPFFTILITLCICSISFSQEKSVLDKAIIKNRTGVIVIKTTPNTKVEVQQLKHEFWFGSSITGTAFDGRMSDEDVTKYKEKFLENYNCAVTEWALLGNIEREKGKVDFATVDNILEWTDGNDIPLRGHCIYWGIPYRMYDWLKEMDDNELMEALHTRARTIAARYKGKFAEYDLNNEMLHRNYYEERLGPDITKKMADWIKTYDPDAVLYLNEYDILTARLDKEYVAHIQNFIDQGVPFEGIGVQGHLHAETFSPDSLQLALDMLAEFDLPIRITEFNIPGQRSKYLQERGLMPTKKEYRQLASNLSDYYRICFAHPAVDGILMWGFWAGANWIPASSLYDKDWGPTPLLEAYQSLVLNEWWTDASGTSDEKGVCVIRAFFGKHKVIVNGVEKEITLIKEKGSAYIDLSKP